MRKTWGGGGVFGYVRMRSRRSWCLVLEQQVRHVTLRSRREDYSLWSCALRLADWLPQVRELAGLVCVGNAK